MLKDLLCYREGYMDIHDVKQFLLYLGCEPVLLMEDSMLSGFVPLLSAPIEISYVHNLVDKVCLIKYLLLFLVQVVKLLLFFLFSLSS